MRAAGRELVHRLDRREITRPRKEHRVAVLDHWRQIQSRRRDEVVHVVLLMLHFRKEGGGNGAVGQVGDASAFAGPESMLARFHSLLKGLAVVPDEILERHSLSFGYRERFGFLAIQPAQALDVTLDDNLSVRQLFFSAGLNRNWPPLPFRS